MASTTVKKTLANVLLSQQIKYRKKIRKCLQDVERYSIEDMETKSTTLRQLNDNYAHDIVENMLRWEQQNVVDPRHKRMQNNITMEMRSSLINYMFRIASTCFVSEDALFQSTRIFDRFLEKKAVQLESLEIVASAALMIAAKIDDCFHPCIREITAKCKHGVDFVTKMERVTLAVLNFELLSPTSLSFLHYFVSALNVSTDILQLARFLCYCFVYDDSACFQQSEIALSALIISMHAHGVGGQVDITLFLDAFANIEEYRQTTMNDIATIVNRCVCKMKRRNITDKTFHVINRMLKSDVNYSLLNTLLDKDIDVTEYFVET